MLKEKAQNMKGKYIAMKRTTLVLIAIFALSIFALTACGAEQVETVPAPQAPESQEITNAPESPPEDTGTEENDTPAPPEEDTPQTISDFAFKMGDVLIEMDQDINKVIEKLGEPLGIFEAPSCAFDGIDRIFGYPGMQIHTYPKGDSDFIHTISLRDDSLRTTEGGIRLGDDIQTALDAYGDDYELDTGLYRFKRGLTTLEFLTEDGIVMGITYGFLVEIQ